MADDKKAKLTGKETARITSICVVGGKTYQPNQVVEKIPAKELQDLIDNNRASLDDAGIAYCLDDLGVTPIDHTAKPEKKPKKTAEKEAE